MASFVSESPPPWRWFPSRRRLLKSHAQPVHDVGARASRASSTAHQVGILARLVSLAFMAARCRCSGCQVFRISASAAAVRGLTFPQAHQRSEALGLLVDKRSFSELMKKW